MRVSPLTAIVLTVLAALGATTLAAQSPSAGILGFWREPTGSVIDIFRCGPDVCARMAAISKQAPTQLDEKNPDPAARHQSLCGLQIGYGFRLVDAGHAEGGRLYDPKTGKTYHGAMTAESNQLHLRGYVGIKAFGRSETWQRTDRSAATCNR